MVKELCVLRGPCGRETDNGIVGVPVDDSDTLIQRVYASNNALANFLGPILEIALASPHIRECSKYKCRQEEKEEEIKKTKRKKGKNKGMWAPTVER